MVTIQELFLWGMDRKIPPLLDPPDGPQLNLGPGNVKDIPNTIGVGRLSEDLTDVRWEYPEPLPFDDGSVAAVHAYHFMEHFSGEDCLRILRDIQRVLMPGGVVFICTPYPDTPGYWRALDHQSAWCEETWDWVFSNPYYAGGSGGVAWKLKLHACFIMAIVERNRALFSQLVKK
jgi:SAM-dependent methyltransferase